MGTRTGGSRTPSTDGLRSAKRPRSIASFLSTSPRRSRTSSATRSESKISTTSATETISCGGRHPCDADPSPPASTWPACACTSKGNDLWQKNVAHPSPRRRRSRTSSIHTSARNGSGFASTAKTHAPWVRGAIPCPRPRCARADRCAHEHRGRVVGSSLGWCALARARRAPRASLPSETKMVTPKSVSAVLEFETHAQAFTYAREWTERGIKCERDGNKIVIKMGFDYDEHQGNLATWLPVLPLFWKVP